MKPIQMPKIVEKLKEQEEQKIFKNFFKLGYSVHYSEDNKDLIEFINVEEMSIIKINKKSKRYMKLDNVIYSSFVPISAKEHILLHKLFELWGWFDE